MQSLKHLLLLLPLVNCQFINPPESTNGSDFTASAIWQLGSQQQISWATNLTDYYIGVSGIQDIYGNSSFPTYPIYNTSSGIDKITRDGNVNILSWTVANFNMSISNTTYWCSLVDSTGNVTHFSADFNISSPAGQTSSVASLPTMPPTSIKIFTVLRTTERTAATPATTGLPSGTASTSSTSTSKSGEGGDVRPGPGPGLVVPMLVAAVAAGI